MCYKQIISTYHTKRCTGRSKVDQEQMVENPRRLKKDGTPLGRTEEAVAEAVNRQEWRKI